MRDQLLSYLDKRRRQEECRQSTVPTPTPRSPACAGRAAGFAHLGPTEQKRALKRFAGGEQRVRFANVSAAPSPTGESVPLWLAVGVPPLSQGQLKVFLAQKDLSEPLRIIEPEISL